MRDIEHNIYSSPSFEQLAACNLFLFVPWYVCILISFDIFLESKVAIDLFTKFLGTKFNNALCNAETVPFI